MLVDPGASGPRVMFILDECARYNLCQMLIQCQCKKQCDIYIALRKVCVDCMTLTPEHGGL